MVRLQLTPNLPSPMLALSSKNNVQLYILARVILFFSEQKPLQTSGAACGSLGTLSVAQVG